MDNYYTSFFRRGNRVYIREVVKGSDERNHLNIEYKPKLYLESSLEESNCKYKTLSNIPLKEVEFSNIKSLRDYVSSYNGNLYGFPRHEYACIDDIYPEEIEYDFNNLRLVYLDIEVNSDTHYSSVGNPDQEVILIQLMYDGKFYILGTQFYESYEDNVVYIRCTDEIDLLKKFVKLFRKIDPDILVGYNSQSYDIPYLKTRCDFLEIPEVFKRLSPFNQIEERDEEVFGKMQLRINIMGIQHLDYIHLLKKFDLKKYENYRLGTVSQEILKKTKVEYQGSLHDLYVTNFDDFVHYGIRDVELLQEMEDKTNLIQLVVMLGYKSKTNYEDSYFQIRMWDCTFYSFLKHNRNVQVSYTGNDNDDDSGYEGAFVKEPVPGKYKWIVTDDVASLYPSIIMALNMSPETYVGQDEKNVKYFVDNFDTSFTENLKSRNVSCAANGSMYTREFLGFVPEVLNKEFLGRISAKKLSREAKTEMEKIKQVLSSRGVEL